MTDQGTPAYRDESLPIDRRVEDLCSRMTVAEKVAQLESVPPRWMDVEDESEMAARRQLLAEDGTINEANARELLGDSIGHLTRMGGGGGLDPETAASVTERVQEIAIEESRFDLATIPHEECLSGYMGPGGTTYPQGIGLASTWDPDGIEEMADRIRDQLRAIGTYHALSPLFDVARDPRWGRTEETFGEDPYLVARMGSAFVDGLQGADPEEGISATLKHFAGHAVGEGGKNRSTVHLGERELREVHLFPFEVAIAETDADSVMNAYHDVDGVPCTADEWLLTEVLREEWGFDGTVVSDYFSVRLLKDEHRIAPTYEDAAIQAIEAGLDVELPQIKTFRHLPGAVEAGDVAEKTIDTAVRRVLKQKIEKGLIGDTGVDPDRVEDAFGPEKNRELARKLACESITLLKNDDDLLPLSGEASVAVLGPKADAPAGQLGDYAYAAHYPEAEVTREIVTPLDALRDRLDEGNVEYVEGCPTTGPETDDIDDAVDAAAEADVAVAFVGARSAIALSDDEGLEEVPDLPTSGEGADVTDLGLPGVQQELVEAVHGTDTPLVVVQISGKPHAIEWIDQHVPAILHAWLPGEEGGTAIADVLLGEHTPSGHLPISIPKDVGQLPVYYARRPNSRNERHVFVDEDPLYPFGHGLSYTDFEYGDVSLDSEKIAPTGTIEASVSVENVGDVAGHEVVQVYTHQRWPSQARPVQELRAFERVSLEPDESATVTVELSATQLAFHDRNMDLVVDPGEYELRIGASAADIETTADFEIVGDRRELPRSAHASVAETTVEAASSTDDEVNGSR